MSKYYEWYNRDKMLIKIKNDIKHTLSESLAVIDFERETNLNLKISFTVAPWPSKGVEVYDFDIESPEHHKTINGYFGLSYASFLVLPRVLMQEMSEKWQNKFVALLDEWDKEFPNMPVDTFQVRATSNTGKLVKMPSSLSKYKYPEYEEINKMRRG